MAYFTNNWKHTTVDDIEEDVRHGKIRADLDHTASDLFDDRGVGPGDSLYVITFRDGDLEVVGRMIVDEVVGYREACRRLDYSPWESRDHAMARKSEMTPMVFDVKVKPADVRLLLFTNRNETVESPPARWPDGRVNHQTFRGVRRITADAAAILDRTLAAHGGLSSSRSARSA